MAKSSSKRTSTRSRNTDIISTLPDHLLHHILSFLPIKQAVATTLLLSKRFNPLALTMPSFNLQGSAFPSLNAFIQFVDALLLLSHSKPIKMFCLKFNSDKSFEVPPIRINLWVNSVMSRQIEHLELDFIIYDSPIDVPTSVFHNQTIRVLKLSWVIVNARSPVHLPSLKVLHLVDVDFSGPESAGNFLNGCSFLEELVLERTDLLSGDFSDTNIGRFQHLTSAVAFQSIDLSLLLTTLSNVEFLRLEGLPLVNEVIPTFHNLIELELIYVPINSASELVECLESFPKLEILNILEVIPGWGLRPIGNPTIMVPQCVAASNLQDFSLGKYKGSECEFELARFIMKNASDLRTISISCAAEVVDTDSKLQMLRRLSSCPRGSVSCRLFFN